MCKRFPSALAHKIRYINATKKTTVGARMTWMILRSVTRCIMKPATIKPVTIGLIVGNRGFFPAQLCEKGRSTMLEVLEKAGHTVQYQASK